MLSYTVPNETEYSSVGWNSESVLNTSGAHQRGSGTGESILRLQPCPSETVETIEEQKTQQQHQKTSTVKSFYKLRKAKGR